MRPSSFEFHAPTDVDQALTLLDQLGPDAIPLAGGQTLIPLLNMRLARPAHVVDLNRLAELTFIESTENGLRIGAMTRQYQLEESALLRARCPLLAHALPFVGHAQTRSRGTLGGSLAFASSVGELSVALLALGADVHVAGVRGRRSVPIDDFFVNYLTTVLEPGELLTEVRIPMMSERTHWGFSELKLRSCDFPIVVAAAVIQLDGTGRCLGARITVGGAAATPVRVSAAEAEIEGKLLSPLVIEAAASATRELAVDAVDEPRASAAYRHAMVPLQVRQAVTMALSSSRND